jgi:dipeptidyl-peptidase-4
MRTSVIHLLLFVCASISLAESPAPKSTEGPQIILDQASAEIFPESWRTAKINAKAEALADTERERCRKVVDRALAKYPAEMLAATLKKIYCVGSLEYSGVVTGGTRSKSAIYIVCKPNYASAEVERIVHAEYSSVLFQKHRQHFGEAAWKAINPTDFNYLGGGVQAVKRGQATRRTDEATRELGFIKEYAKASIEEDFNCHAAPLLMGDATYWEAVAKHPKLNAKSDLVIAFYSKIHGSFSPAKFQALRDEEAKTRVEASKLTLQRIFTDKDFEEEKLGLIRWSKRSGHYFVLEAPGEGKLGKDLVKHEAATGEKTILASAQTLTPSGETKPLSIDSFEFSADEKHALLFTNTKKVWRKNTRGDYWLMDLASKKLTKLGGDSAASSLMFAKLSPDGKRVAYVQKNNLHVQTLADLKITALTKDGNDTIINGTSDWVNEEELGLRDGFRWSPDGSQLLFWQFDTSDVKRFSLVNQSDSKDQVVTTLPYPTAGEKNSAIRLGILSANGGEVRWLQIDGDPREHYLPKAEWTSDGKGVLVQQFNRLQNILKVLLADPVTGSTKVVLIETDKAWVENKNEIVWIGADFLWQSERSGWRHAYRVSLDGALKPITKGEFDVIEIVKLNAKAGSLDFIASLDNATQRYLYRVSLEGGEPVRLSPAEQPGTHSYDVSEDARWAVHTHSSMTTPPVIQLVSLPDHRTIRILKAQKMLSEKLKELTLPKTEFLRVDIGTGITLDGWMISAKGLDTVKKHPLLMHVYGEPASQTVRDSWGGQRFLWHAMLAQLGYVVVSVDTRGTPSPKGCAWRKAVYRQLGILNSAEQAAAVQALLKRFPLLDPQRVGIWGWSGGGSSSLDALFRYPELYKTAIAVAPVADRTLYDSIYEERYMGLPKDNADGYKLGSPIAHAKNLKGQLLLIHGTGDDNVHYRGTERLMNELIAHNKSFTIMPYPNRDHAINTGKGISRHLYELMTAFLLQHLPVTDPPP